jgi:hypothetical protein
LIKRILLLLVPVAAVLAVMLAPVSASADTFFKCPTGVTDHRYCAKVTKCVVPKLKGKSVKQARKALRKHNCHLGKVVKHSHKGGKVGKVYKSSPKAHTKHHKGKKVKIFVKKKT